MAHPRRLKKEQKNHAPPKANSDIYQNKID